MDSSGRPCEREAQHTQTRVGRVGHGTSCARAHQPLEHEHVVAASAAVPEAPREPRRSARRRRRPVPRPPPLLFQRIIHPPLPLQARFLGARALKLGRTELHTPLVRPRARVHGPELPLAQAPARRLKAAPTPHQRWRRRCRHCWTGMVSEQQALVRLRELRTHVTLLRRWECKSILSPGQGWHRRSLYIVPRTGVADTCQTHYGQTGPTLHA
jgi:hypothetical protein